MSRGFMVAGCGGRLRRSVAVAALVVATVCACGSESDPEVAAAVSRAVAMSEAATADVEEPVPSEPATVEAPAPEPSRGVAEPSESPSREPAARNPARVAARAWRDYPWPPNYDGKACVRPALPASADSGPTVVVLGDSLMRNGMSDITDALDARGHTPVFVCWGGKTTQWGVEQIDLMRQLGLLPQCLVVNLGTNDVKNEAVLPGQLRRRLATLLEDARDVPHVVVVDLWANTDIAPSTMAQIDATVPAYPAAVADAGHGTVAPWSALARADGSLVGPDGVHDSASGQRVRARLIADAVAEECGSG